VKRHGRLCFPETSLQRLREALLGVRERVMARGGYAYRPVAPAPRPAAAA
jgi:hypothetical protein